MVHPDISSLLGCLYVLKAINKVDVEDENVTR